MNSLKAIIIDDEPDCVRVLELQLAKHCPEVQVIGKTEIAEEGLVMLLKTPPDLLFLDIEMPRMNGFDLLEKVGNLNFKSFLQRLTTAMRFGRSNFQLWIIF